MVPSAHQVHCAMTPPADPRDTQPASLPVSLGQEEGRSSVDAENGQGLLDHGYATAPQDRGDTEGSREPGSPSPKHPRTCLTTARAE